MNGYSALDRFLQTDPRDVGCAQAIEILHVYAELVAAGEPADQAVPRASRRTCARAALCGEGLRSAAGRGIRDDAG